MAGEQVMDGSGEGSGLGRGAKWTLGITLAGVLITGIVSIYGVVVARQTADKQDSIEQAIAQANRAQSAPRTKLAFRSAAIDATGQVLTLNLAVEGVGAAKGLGCSLVDREQITNNALPPGAGKGQGQLQAVPAPTPTTGSTGSTAATGSTTTTESSGTAGALDDFDLAPGEHHDLSVEYHRSVDGIIQIAIDAPCSTPDSTTSGVTVTVVSSSGALQAPVKESPTPGA